MGNQEEERAEENCEVTGACAGAASSATPPGAIIGGFYFLPSLRTLCQLASLRRIIPKLKQHKQTTIYSRTISQGQAGSPDSGEWFWLRVSHEATAKLSAGSRQLKAQRAPGNPPRGHSVAAGLTPSPAVGWRFQPPTPGVSPRQLTPHSWFLHSKGSQRRSSGWKAQAAAT